MRLLKIYVTLCPPAEPKFFKAAAHALVMKLVLSLEDSGLPITSVSKTIQNVAK